MNGKNLRRRPLAAGILLLALAGAARAAAPVTLTYQGRLKEGGFPVTALRSIDLQLCDAPAPGGTCYDTGVQSVSVTNGLFRVVFPVPAGVNLETGTWYVEVHVGAATFLPREQLSASPFAVYSSSASTLIAAPGVANVLISTVVAISGQDASGYSLTLSSGISTPNGTVTAKYFVGNGAGLTGLSSVDGTKVLRTGDTMSGTLNMVGAAINLTGTGGTVTGVSSMTASAFFGDGSHLTGITASGAVLKAGDTMTGQLTNTSTITVLGTGFSVGGSTFVVKGGQVGIGTNNFSTGALLQINTQNDGNLNRISMQGPSNSVVQGLELMEPIRSWNIAQNLGNFGDGRLQIYDATAGRYSALFGANGDISLGGSDAQANPGLVILNAGGVTASSATFAVGVRASTGDFRNGVTVTGTPTYGYYSSGALFDFYGLGDSHIGGKLSVGAGASGKLNVLGTGTGAALFVSTDVAGNSPNLVVANNGDIGLGTTAPVARLHVSSGTLLVDGSTDDGAPTGGGTRMFFLPSSGALRAGQVTGSQFDVPNIGAQSVAFGYNPTASAPWTFVGGGQFNVASGARAVVAGGDSNTASNTAGAVGGGTSNNAGGIGASIPGGYNNVATGDYSFAGGHGAAATHTGAFVWASGPASAAFGSTAAEEVAFRASGGVRFVTGTSTFSISAVGDVTAASSITASAFFGDGSHLLGVNAASAANAVAKAGDGMTGPLTMNGSTITVGGSAFSVGASTFVVVGGRVGIGTNVPDAALRVNGGISNDPTATPALAGQLKTQQLILADQLALGSSGGTSLLVGPGNWSSIQFDLAGAPVMYLNNSGSLGIGTNNPQGAIHTLSAAGSNSAVFENSNDAQIVVRSGDTTERNTGISFESWSTAQGGQRQQAVLRAVPGGDVSLMTTNDGGTSATERLRVTGSGNIGIGTSLPAAKFHMSTGTMLIDGDAVGSPLNPVIYLTRTAGAGGGGTISFGGTNRGLMGVDNNGEVVLGSLGPTAMTFHTNSTSNGLVLDNERMRIDSSGKVGINVGGAAPATMLDVVGDARFGTGAARSAFNSVGSLAIANNSSLGLTGPSGNITTQSSVTASAFFGDASHLTNGPPDSTRVLKTGDTMTGNLNINPGALNIINGGMYSQGAIDNLAAISGPGTRFMWVPSSAAIRAGLVGNTEWNIIGAHSVAFGYNNRAEYDDTVVAGGNGNQVGAQYASVGGGSANSASGSYSVIAGGQSNTAAFASAVGGGASNSAANQYATVPGGYGNTAAGQYSFAAGRLAASNQNGQFTWADAIGASLINNIPNQFLARAVGGVDFMTSSFSVVGATITLFTVDASSAYFGSPLFGDGSHLTGVIAPGAVAKTGDTMTGNLLVNNSTITVVGPLIASGVTGGVAISGTGTRFEWIPSSAAIRAGKVSGTQWDAATIGAYSTAFGRDNEALTDGSAIGGGFNNIVQGSAVNGTIGGGTGNSVTGGANNAGTIGGGANNTEFMDYGTISGGSNNQIFNIGHYGAIGGGLGNQVQGNAGTVAGGNSNSANGNFATIAGGGNNIAGGTYATIPGGYANTATGFGSIALGAQNAANGGNSFAAGSNAYANGAGSFVFNDSLSVPTSGYLNNQFLARVMGGFDVITSSFVFSNAVSTLMYVDSSGVGIGTTTPSAALEVNAPAQPVIETVARFDVADAPSQNLSVVNAVSNAGEFDPKLQANLAGSTGFVFEMNSPGNDPNGDSFVMNATIGGTAVGFRRLLDVRNNNVSKFTISPAGYVGVGTQSPLFNFSFGRSSATIGVEDQTSSIAGGTVTIRAGSAGSGAGAAGGPLFLQAGNGAGTAGADGGSVFVMAGSMTGTAGKPGDVVLSPGGVGAGAGVGKLVLDSNQAGAMHLKTVQTTLPGASAGASCGTGPSAAVQQGGSDLAGVIQFTAGTGAPTTACTLTLNFVKSFTNSASQPLKVLLSPNESNSAGLQLWASPTAGPNTSSLTIGMKIAPTVSTVYAFSYMVIE